MSGLRGALSGLRGAVTPGGFQWVGRSVPCHSNSCPFWAQPCATAQPSVRSLVLLLHQHYSYLALLLQRQCSAFHPFPHCPCPIRPAVENEHLQRHRFGHRSLCLIPVVAADPSPNHQVQHPIHQEAQTTVYRLSQQNDLHRCCGFGPACSTPMVAGDPRTFHNGSAMASAPWTCHYGAPSPGAPSACCHTGVLTPDAPWTCHGNSPAAAAPCTCPDDDPAAVHPCTCHAGSLKIVGRWTSHAGYYFDDPADGLGSRACPEGDHCTCHGSSALR